jgi:hypothetical protein
MMYFQIKENIGEGFKKNEKDKNSLFQEIENEYSIKRCNFNPLSPSPNKFIKNLEIRMKMYYKQLYKSYK